jgi:uncharacterized protein YbjT (DUF2867 family)
MIAVIGPTGNVGRGIVELLRNKRMSVRALTRNPGMRPEEGLEVAVTDFHDRAATAAAMQNVEAMFIMAPVAVLAEQTTAVVAVARQHGVRRLVLLSSLCAEQPPNNAPTLQHQMAEEIVRESGCEWTILRGGQFMSNTLRWAASIRSARQVRPYVRNDPSAIIDPLDISAVAVEALRCSTHRAKTYGLTGAEELTPEQCTKILSERLGIRLDYVELSDEEAERAYVQLFGDTAEVREKLRALRASADLPWQKRRPTVSDILGRSPRRFAQWVDVNATAFR